MEDQDMPTKTPLECRATVIAARIDFGQGRITEARLYAICDEYIDAIKEFKKRTGNKKLPVPTRSYLLRAL
jgi:hypothetical protein